VVWKNTERRHHPSAQKGGRLREGKKKSPNTGALVSNVGGAVGKKIGETDLKKWGS